MKAARPAARESGMAEATFREPQAETVISLNLPVMAVEAGVARECRPTGVAAWQLSWRHPPARTYGTGSPGPLQRSQVVGDRGKQHVVANAPCPAAVVGTNVRTSTGTIPKATETTNKWIGGSVQAITHAGRGGRDYEAEELLASEATTEEREDTRRAAPWMLRAWGYLPSSVRRLVIRPLRSPRLRLTLLSLLRIRDRSGFITVSSGLGAIDAMMDRLRRDGPSGDYYEFGLYRGYTFWHAQKAADRIGMQEMRFFGFDSFDGLPEVQGEDKKAGFFVPGDYSCSKEEVTRLLSEHDFDWARGTLIEGFFDESLNDSLYRDHGMDRASLVMIDCDLYQSTVPVLRFMEPILQEGTIIIFDDWYCFNEAADRGEPRAFREFLDNHPHWTAESIMEYPGYGKVFVMHRRESVSKTDIGPRESSKLS